MKVPATMTRSCSFVFVFSSCLCFVSEKSQATPVFTTAQCNVPASNLWNTDPGDPIAVYIEDDFGTELDSCVTTGDADGINDYQARNVIRAAMEVWNREARSTVLHYAGTKSYEEVTSGNCSDFASKPAIYIRFEEGCDSLADSDCGTSATCNLNIGYARPVSSCGNVIQITVPGDAEERGGCGTEPVQWNITGEQLIGGCSFDLFSNLVHELGHALGLGHPSEAVGGDASSMQSVMVQGVSFPVNRHLYPWDMDCVDDAVSSGAFQNHRGVRSATYNWKGLDSTGAWVGSIESETATTKGFFGGGHLHRAFANSSPVYAYYSAQQELWTSGVGVDGYLPFTIESDFCNSQLEDLYTGPTLMKAHEYTGSGQAQRINYARYATSAPITYADYDPPFRRLVRSDDFFDSSCATSTYLESDGSTEIQSHVPMVSAYDAHTGHTVFVVVDTFRNQANHGKIKVYPGFVGSSSVTLSDFSILSDNQTAPTDSDPDFDYTLKTDVTPGVACAPDDTLEFNCILAWMDRGHPDYRVLYTYFRVDESNPSDLQIEWIDTSPNVWVRSAAYTHGDVSAAFFDGSFWVAWKADDTDQDVEWTKSTSSVSYTTWSTVTQLGTSNVVDAPTWLYTPNATKESALIWTQWTAP